MTSRYQFFFAPPQRVLDSMEMTDVKWKETAQYLLVSCSKLITFEPDGGARMFFFYEDMGTPMGPHVYEARREFLKSWLRAKDSVVSHLNGDVSAHLFSAAIRVKNSPDLFYHLYPKPLDGIEPVEFIIEKV